MFTIRRAALPPLLVCLALLAGCYEGPEEAKDYGEFRLHNLSDRVVTLSVSGELKLTVPPGKRSSTRTPEGLVEVSIQQEGGKVLWKQYADVPDNTFAQYNVQADGSIVTTAGNVSEPENIGSRKEQVWLDNQAPYPVEVLVDNAVIGAVPAYLYMKFNTPKEIFRLQFRRKGGKVLFSQTWDIPRNGYISYSVKPDGTVVATGGEVKANRYPVDYPNPYPDSAYGY
jgi:hypothetical protein